MKYLLLILLTATSLVYAGQIFMTTNSDGTTVYSDTPSDASSKVVTTSDANIVSMPATTPINSANATQAGPNSNPTSSANPLAQTKVPYTIFTISSPSNGETLQNQPVIYVSISVKPTLQQGDYVQVYLDGQPWGQAQATTSFQFTAPDRGTHVISAKLFDKNGSVLMSSAGNTIYVHQAALGGNGLAR